VGLSSNFTGELGATTARLILAWRNLRTWIGTDSDGLYFDLTGSEFRDEHDQYSGELDVTGTRGQLTYTAGVFALVERAESFPTRSPLQNSVLLTCRCFFPPGGGPQPLTVHRLLKGESYAIFGQASYKLTDRLSGTLGARYSNEKKSIRAESILVDRVTLLPTETVFATGRNRDSWGALTWRAGLEFQATRDIMVYGAAAKGYKSGGFNVRPVTNLPNLGLASFGPETAILYEMGARSEWLDRRLRLNLTLFHTSYRDIQLRRQTEIDGILTTLIENAARARIRGVEVELLARPLERLTLSLAYGHLAPQYLDPGGVPGITTESRFQRTPGHSLAGSVHFEQPVRGGTIELHGDVGYRSKEQFQLLPRPHDPDGYGLLRARATFRPAGGGWSLAVFGTNLTNKEYRTAGRGTVEEGGIAFSSVGMPRTFGVQAQFDY
jgi:iron complex outermembrane receptor protein